MSNTFLWLAYPLGLAARQPMKRRLNQKILPGIVAQYTNARCPLRRVYVYFGAPKRPVSLILSARPEAHVCRDILLLRARARLFAGPSVALGVSSARYLIVCLLVYYFLKLSSRAWRSSSTGSPPLGPPPPPTAWAIGPSAVFSAPIVVGVSPSCNTC